MTDLAPSDRLEPQGWMIAAPVAHVMEALSGGGHPARFVGGCVRDALIGRPVRDIDIATPEPPENVMRLLEAAGIRAIPTGLKHGTVTAVSEGQPFEITTLRVDAETDGRWARVEFTEDWRADARRRDFTMNALYCDPDGAIYDPAGGVDDLRAGCVRFIGEASARLAEDYLRLLRFFRFSAWYGKGTPDETGLAACRAAAPHLPELSGERVWQELSRLLTAPDPAPTLALMTAQGIQPHLLPIEGTEQMDADRVTAMATVEENHQAAPDAIRRLAAWLSAALDGDEKKKQDSVRKVSSRLVHSNQERARLRNLLLPEYRPGADISAAENRKILYWLGDASAFIDLVLYRWALNGGDNTAWGTTADLPLTDPPPAFPLGGDDVMALGIAPGPRVGELLAAVEEWWVDRDFADDPDALRERLGALAAG